MRRSLVVSLALAISLCASAVVRPAAKQASGRIVAIGDIHGSFDGLTQILRTAGLVDDKLKWSGGNTRLVQTGDYLDRGQDVRKVLDLLMQLESDARRAGGRVDILFGNHEGMNVLRDLRDVSLQAYASFADNRSEDRRRRAFDTHAAIAKRAGTTLAREAWMAAHPPGFFEYVDALGPDGHYGKWIRARKVIAPIDDTIFMHAGLNPDRSITVEEVNRTVEREIRNWDDLTETLERARLAAPFFTLKETADAATAELIRISAALKSQSDVGEHVTQEFVQRLQSIATIDKWALIEAEGPLWYRGLATLPDDAQPAIEAMLTRYGARRIVTGHNPQVPGRIKSRFGGRVFLIDTGMLTSYFKGGQPSALEIRDGKVSAIYASGTEAIAGGR